MKYDVPVIKSKKYLKVFIGKDKKHLTSYWIGSTILIQLTKRKYLFIGDEIKTIIISEPVLGYYNIAKSNENDWPYPYIIGKQNVYLLHYDTYVPIDLIKSKDPYVDFLFSGILYNTFSYREDENEDNIPWRIFLHEWVQKHPMNIKVIDNGRTKMK